MNTIQLKSGLCQLGQCYQTGKWTFYCWLLTIVNY